MYNKTLKLSLIVLFLLLCITFFLIAVKVYGQYDHQFYSDSIMMDGTYDINYAMFSWNPSLLPGYMIDTRNIGCVGELRMNLNTYICSKPNSWYYEPLDGKWYFTVELPSAACGREVLWLQPWLRVANLNTAEHDVIYGNIVELDYTFCSPQYLTPLYNGAWIP